MLYTKSTLNCVLKSKIATFLNQIGIVKNMKLVVTIPAYNEEKTLPKVISDIKEAVKKLKYSTTILVVNDGSSDKTVEVAEKAGAVVHSHPRNYGLGETFKTEVEQALKLKADVIVHTDADDQYVAGEIPKLLAEIDKGADLVLGSRFKGKIESMPNQKKFGNRLFSAVVSYIIKQRISDSQTGFRAFKRKVAEQVEISSTFTYTQDQIIGTSRKKFKIVEVPVTFLRRDGSSRLMKGSVDYAMRGGTNLFRLCRDYAPITFFGSIGLMFLLPGLAVGSWLLYRFFTLGYVGKTPSLILTLLLVIIGLQLILFGFIADVKRR